MDAPALMALGAAHGSEIRRVDAPARPGWWWYKDEHPWQVVRVVEMDGSETLWARLTNGNLLRLDNEMEGVWAGPLTPPADSPNDPSSATAERGAVAAKVERRTAYKLRRKVARNESSRA